MFLNSYSSSKSNSVGSSVGSDVGCQSRGCEIQPKLDKPFSDVCHMSSTNGLRVYVEKQPVAWKVCCGENWPP